MNQQASGGSGLAPNVASMLCYLCGFVTGIIFLLIEKDNKEVKFHAWHAISLNVAIIAIYIGLTILSAILGMIAGPLAAIVGILMLLVNLTYFVVWILNMVKAFQGQRLVIPYLTDFAEKQANK